VADALAEAAGVAGKGVDRDRWTRRAWCHRVRRAVERICERVPAGEQFILIDEAQWGADRDFFGRICRHFLERDGNYHGRPADEAQAVAELERMRAEGVRHVAVAWCCTWWLEAYPALHARLRRDVGAVVRDPNLILFTFDADRAARP
jgi:hypothetical protein